MRLLPLQLLLVMLLISVAPGLAAEPLPKTKPIEGKDDLALKMVEGIHKYLDQELAASVTKRQLLWKPDFSSAEAFHKSIAPHRERLAKLIGVVDKRLPSNLEYVGGPDQSALVAETEKYKVFAIRWAVLPGVDGEGLMLEPKGKIAAQVIAVPDADWTPEQLVGLAPGVPKESQFARRLAEQGARVVVPVLIDRKDEWSGNSQLRRATNQPHREFVYRMAYQMGRHIIGYEVQKVLALVDWMEKQDDVPAPEVWGYGEGGSIALYSAAVDDRLARLWVSGYLKQRETVADEPIYRNVWGLLTEFGDAQLALMARANAKGKAEILIEGSTEPNISGPPMTGKGRGGAAPGAITTDVNKSFAESERFAKLTQGKISAATFIRSEKPFVTLNRFPNETKIPAPQRYSLTEPKELRKNFNPGLRQKRQFDQLVAHVQQLWRNSDATRVAYWNKGDHSSPEKWDTSCETYRNYFWEEVIGKLPAPTLPMNPKSREIYSTEKWKGYEITLDLYPDVFAYGILLLPNNLKEGEKRPVVVCQHGLEGRPTDVCNPKEKTKYYNSFGAQLADLGYIVFAPQNPYIFKNDFRQLQRKANPLKLSLFSFIIRQHEQILDWLSEHPNVDASKMAFYGLSYGGKTAMRVPAVLKKYNLSICSGDFNEWIGKNVSVTLGTSYMWTGEYEMYEFDLGNTFNYAEMAYLIAPRPFMVERGHNDGVGIDEMVAYEYAKVRHLYANRLKIADRTEIEWFAGGHEINSKGTFAFLKKHLQFPK